VIANQCRAVCRAELIKKMPAAAQGQTRAQCRCQWQRRLLLDHRDRQAFLSLDFAVVELDVSRNRIQQGALTGAVASDQPDAIAGLHCQRCSVEQWL